MTNNEIVSEKGRHNDNNTKHMEYTELKIKEGFVARDAAGDLYMFAKLPKRHHVLRWDIWKAQDDDFEKMDPELFPNLTWEDEPISVRIETLITYKVLDKH